jgi:hypothetical protein
VTADTIQLVDGRRLTQRRGSWRLDPPGMTVAVELAAGLVRLTDPDNGQVLEDQLPVSDKCRPLTKPARRAKAGARTAGEAGRWAMLNEFIDTTIRTIGEAEGRVWLVLFRDVRGGLARTGMTDIATRTGMTRRAVVKAIASLKRCGLVEVATRGSVNGSTNSYRIHAAPNLGNGGSLASSPDQTKSDLGNGGSLGNPECQT